MKSCRGFSLIEMAFVLVIITLLLGGLLVPFATQVEQRRIAETQKAMEEIKEALLGFAVANGRLPCPDTTVAGVNANDGREDPPVGGPCAVLEGNLPWVTLGVSNSDAWGNRFRYRVTDFFATPGKITLGPPPTLGMLRVCSTSGCGAGTIIADTIPAVVISHGKNGYGAVNSNITAGTTGTNIAPTSPDELANTDNNNDFVSRTITTASTPCGGAGQPLCEFDDLVVWLSPNILFNRMVAAGKLP